MPLCSTCQARFNATPTPTIVQTYIDAIFTSPPPPSTSCEACLDVLSLATVHHLHTTVLAQLQTYQLAPSPATTTYHLNLHLPFSISIVRHYLTGSFLHTDPDRIASVRAILYDVLNRLVCQTLPTLVLLPSDDTSAKLRVDCTVLNAMEEIDLYRVLPTTARPAKRRKKRRNQPFEAAAHKKVELPATNALFDRVQVLKAAQHHVAALQDPLNEETTLCELPPFPTPALVSSATTTTSSASSSSASSSSSSSSAPASPLTWHTAVHRHSTYIEGNYLKHLRGLTQSPWFCDGQRIGSSSVQEMVCNRLVSEFECEHKFHSAGREDMDVRMLGSGRPFVLELLDSKKDPALQEAGYFTTMQASINQHNNGDVEIQQLRVGGSTCMSDMLDGAAFKQKTYLCLVQLTGRAPTAKDFEVLNNTTELKLMQQTPIRVLHRRTQMNREKIVHWMKCEPVPNTHCFVLHVCTSAGTYVKEMVHGDRGRTVPSVADLLDVHCDILQLDVVEIVEGSGSKK